MTKPKMRSCPKCGASNPASLRTCVSCYVCLLKSKEFKEKEKAVRTGKWGQNCLKYRNGARVVASARIMVSKLAALGYHPILLMGKKKKNAVTADTITYMCPQGDGPMKPFLETMSRAYEYILTETLRIQVEEAATSLSPQQYTTSSSHPPCVSHPPHPSSSPSQLSPSSSSPLHPPPRITSNPRPSSPTLLTNSSTSTSPRSFPPHPSHPSSCLTPSFSHPLIKSEEEACPLTSVTVPFSPRFYRASSTAPAQSNMNKSVPRKHSVSPQPLKSQPVETEGGVPSQCCSSPRPAVSSVSTRTTGCRNCSKQQMFYYDQAMDTRVKEDTEEVKVRWLPCVSCWKTWEDTWEPANSMVFFVKLCQQST